MLRATCNERGVIVLQEIWEPDLRVVFVGAMCVSPSDTLGFHHLHQRDRFWELLEVNAITPVQIITKSERKALVEGQARGNLSDPIRLMYIQKKTSQLLKLGIGVTDLNQREVAGDENDKAVRPTMDDVDAFAAKVKSRRPAKLAFVVHPELFCEVFQDFGPSDVLGQQAFAIGGAEVWLLGSTIKVLRGELLTKQEDAFFALSESLESMAGGAH